MWIWNRQTVRVGFDHLGEGSTLLLLPAFSSISTRQEMRPLQERLASEFATVAIDWPGFGAEPQRPWLGDLLLMRAFCSTSSPTSHRAHSRQ